MSNTKALELAEAYADAASTHRIESVYGTSKSYTLKKANELDAAHEALAAELRRLAAENESLREAAYKARQWIAERPQDRPISAGEMISVLDRAMFSAAPSQQAQQVAQPASVQSEPMAWMVCQGVQPYQLCGSEKHATTVAAQKQKEHDLSGSLASFLVKPLYTHPQQASEPMTDALESALEALVNRCNNDAGLTNDDAVIAAEAALERLYKSRAIERHHKIGGK